MNPNHEQLRELLRIIAATEPTEINCNELLSRVGGFLELSRRGQELPPEFDEISQHLTVCPECRKEYEALVACYVEKEGPST